MFKLGPVSARDLERYARDAVAGSFTYDDVGATLAGRRPPGFRVDHYEIECPSTPQSFALAVDGLRQWRAHRNAGLRVAPLREPAPGLVVAVALRTGLLTSIAPCQVVDVVDDDDRWGFAYGTLAGHPETGEESFVITRRGARVVFEIDAFSRPAEALARLAGPLARQAQVRTTRRYLRGLVDHVRKGAHVA